MNESAWVIAVLFARTKIIHTNVCIYWNRYI